MQPCPPQGEGHGVDCIPFQMKARSDDELIIVMINNIILFLIPSILFKMCDVVH